MANDTMVTIQGWIGSEPVLREVAGTPVLNFRVGATPRHFNRSAGEWVDGHTQWYAVSAWRRLAEHGEKSLRQGDAVVVHGRLQHRAYVNRAGVETVAIEIDAITVGHDLTRGTASFVKATPVVEPQGTAPAARGGQPGRADARGAA